MVGSRYPLLGDARDDLVNGEALVRAAPDDRVLGGIRRPHVPLWISGRVPRCDRSRHQALRACAEPGLQLCAQSRTSPSALLCSRRHFFNPASTRASAPECGGRYVSIGRVGLLAPFSGIQSLAQSPYRRRSQPHVDLMVWALRYGGRLAEAESLLNLGTARAATDAERKAVRELAWTYYVNRGLPTQALGWIRDPEDPEERGGHPWHNLRRRGFPGWRSAGAEDSYC